MTQTTYCTILATNYLPKALSLADSLRKHHDGAQLVVLLIDAASDADLPDLSGLSDVRLVSTAFLDLPERQIPHLATIYNLVEFATAIKPPLLKKLLAETDQVFYLDPDTYVTSPMDELTPELQASEGGILLTPHFLKPLPSDAPVTEGHMLNVGVFNLGFCGVDRRALRFLDWWWDRLREECLFEPMSGLFVDQKWIDIGNTLFEAGSLRQYGYNVGVLNLHERPIGRDDEGLVISSNGHRLRLFHFHAFDTSAPEELSTRFDTSTSHLRTDNTVLDALCQEYAENVIHYEQLLDAPPAYPYATDSRGRRISRQIRRAYRVESQSSDTPLPLPFYSSEAEAYETWRRRAWKPATRELVGDAAKGVRLALPEEYARVKNRFPKLAGTIRTKFVNRSGLWG